jgi:hypothetical protein
MTLETLLASESFEERQELLSDLVGLRIVGLESFLYIV